MSCRARQSRPIFLQAPSGAISRGSTFAAVYGCRIRATASSRRRLVRATAGNSAALVVIYCMADCWMSWNAAKRIRTYGYSNVAWYPEGTDGWERAGQELTEAHPEPRAVEETSSPR
jgi:PQQ-dependent catabolism-associated CXXCW motif protein